MKKVFYPLACCCLAAGVFASCGGQKKANAQEEPSKVALSYSKSLKAPETDSLNLPVDENGYITIFDGETFNGWRGYGKDRVPTKWTIEDGCIKFNGSGGGEAQDGDGGDLIFAHKFKNFELELEWKVAKGSNSGILYLAQEVTSKDKDPFTSFPLPQSPSQSPHSKTFSQVLSFPPNPSGVCRICGEHSMNC